MSTIQEVELNDTFLTFMEKTNAAVEVVNMQISDEQLARLTTDDKETIVGAINEINKYMLNTKGGTVEGNLTTTGYLSSNTFIRIGANNNGDTIIYLYDDKRNVYKMLKWNNEKDDLTIEDNAGNHNKVLHENQIIDCTSMNIDLQQKTMIKNLNDSSTLKEGQIVYLPDNKHLVYHDGNKKGGYTVVNTEDIVDLRKLKISESDTTAMFLKDKVVAGTGVKIEKVNSTSNEQLKIKTGLYAGLINFWPGSELSIPDGWLLCNGQALDRTAYAELFSILGTYYGSGDGSKTFNIPNYQGKFLFGVDSTTPWRTTGGEKTHKLTINEMPAHRHSFNLLSSGGGVGDGSGWANNVRSIMSVYYRKIDGSVRNLQHLGSTTNATSNNLVNDNGGGAEHNNMPPFQAGYWIIFTNVFDRKLTMPTDNYFTDTPIKSV